MTNMDRLEEIVARLPPGRAGRCGGVGRRAHLRRERQDLHLQLARRQRHQHQAAQKEAAAVVATDPKADPTGYGLGRHGWISVSIPTTTSATRWREIEEWIRTSYTLVAPNKLARAVLEEDQQPQ